MYRYYTDFINKRVGLSEAKGLSDLDNLRNFLFLSIVQVLVPLGFFVGIYNVFAAILDQEYIIAAIDLSTYFLLLVLVFATRITLPMKRYGLLILLYSLTVLLLIFVGEKGPGLIWLLGVSVMATGLISVRFGYINVVANGVLLIGLFFANQANLLNIPGYGSNSNVMWAVIVSNFLLISFISVYSTGHLLKGLNNSLTSIQKMHLNLKSREEQLTVMYQSINEAIIIVNSYNRIKAMNYKAEELTGYTKEDAFNMLLSFVYQVEKTGKSVIIGTKVFNKATLLAKSGVRYEIEESITKLDYLEDKLYDQVIVFRDMTTYNKAENELRQSHKMQAMGQLAGGIAHDFNNMLAGILGYAELIEIENQDNAKIDRYCKTIIGSSKRAADLTSQLLSFSRQDMVETKELELNVFIDEGLRLLKRTIHPNIIISKELTREALYIQGDQAQIENVILNLGINARDAMPSGGNLVVISEKVELDEVFCSISKFNIQPGSYAKITISDDGTGIPESIIDRIFDPFFTTKQIGQGTGLGLSTVYGTLTAHNGALEVESSPDKGTTFYLYFPLDDDVHSVQINHTRLDDLKLCEEAKVLIIEDEIKVRDLVQSMVELMGLKSIVAHNGEEGLKRFIEDSEGICMVILDFTLPLKNGKDTLESIRNVNQKVPVIMTADTLSHKDKILLRAHNIQGFLIKPFTIKELTNVIIEVLS